jgi:hypothetical protein
MVAAYCPVVANLVNLTVAEKWRRMRQFDTILLQQLAANMMPPGCLVIAKPASTRCLPRTQKPGGKHRSNPGAIDDGDPLSCGRQIVPEM